MSADQAWRNRITARTGGATFDAPGGGYAFSNILAEERELTKANKAGDPGSALLALSIADPTWKMRPEAMDAAVTFYQESADATRYTDNSGVRGDGAAGFVKDTHTLIAEYLNSRYDSPTTFTADWVQYSPGSIKRALSEYVPTLLFDAGTTVVFPTPGYPVMKSDMNRYDAGVLDVPLNYDGTRWTIPTDLKVEGRPVVYANFPHNPTGSGYTRADWEELFAWARANDAILIADEAYIDLRYNDSAVSALEVPRWEESCLVLQSVSKGWNATGLRFGWVVGDPTIIKAMRKVMDVKDSGMFGPSIAAGLTCLQHPEWRDETCKEYEVLHRQLFNGLKDAGFDTSMPDAGLCQFTPGPKGVDGKTFENALECAQWFRKELRVSLMHYTVHGDTWLRWAVTLKPLPQCGLADEASVIQEVVRRLQSVTFEF